MSKEDVLDQIRFHPTESQRLAKKRFWKSYEQNPLLGLEPTLLSFDQIVTLSGASKIYSWIDANPSFFFWFMDKDFEDLSVSMWADESVECLIDIIRSEPVPKLLTAGDKIKAANILLHLADKFPNKRREIMWADRELGRMSDQDVERQLEEARRALKPAHPPASTEDLENIEDSPEHL